MKKLLFIMCTILMVSCSQKENPTTVKTPDKQAALVDPYRRGPLTQEQYEMLTDGDVEYAPDSYFGPYMDCHGNWTITNQEVADLDSAYTEGRFQWIKDLPQILWCPPAGDPIHGE